MEKFIFDIQRFANISNTTSNTVITGTAGNDTIESNASNVTINGAAGNDSIKVSNYQGGIVNMNITPNNVIINGGEGNDSIYKHIGSDFKIDGGVGDDYINNWGGSNVTIDSGEGNDTISSSDSNTTINGSNGNDYIYNYGSNVTINGGEGDDKIDSSSRYDVAYSSLKVSSNVIIIGGNGKDTISNTSNDVTIDGGDGDDNIQNGNSDPHYRETGKNVIINGSNGNDSITNYGSDVTIDGGEGNDSIFAYGSNVTINGGNGNDNIGSYCATIEGGKGDDILGIISSGGTSNVFIYNAGDGNDRICVNENDTLIIAGESYATTRGGRETVVYVGDASITLQSEFSWSSLPVIQGTLREVTDDTVLMVKNGTDDANYLTNYFDHALINADGGNDTIENGSSNFGRNSSSVSAMGKHVTINAGAGDDEITNDGFSVMVNCDDGNDTVTNYGSDVFINGGDGNDRLTNGYFFSFDALCQNITINGGDGNDNISNGFGGEHKGEYSFLIGGAGNDYIFNQAANVTINGGTGDDTIRGDQTQPMVYLYNAGDGNDFIYDFGANDTLIIGGADFTTTGNAYSVFVHVGENIITLSGAATISPIIQKGSFEIPAENPHSNETPAQNITPTTYVYQGGDAVVDTFNSYDFLKFAATYTGFDFAEKDLIIYAAEGSIRINNSKNKLIEIADANGNLTAHAYFADNYGGGIDGRPFDKFEVIHGSDNLPNQIFAGAYGSSLYGGFGANDELYGNVGIDEFVYKYGDGQDNIFNAGAEDAVNLSGISLDQIWAAQIYDNGVNLIFTDGGALSINGQVGNFILGGQSYGADYQSKTWYTK